MTICTSKKQLICAVLLLVSFFATISLSQQRKSDSGLRITSDTDLVTLDAQIISRKTGKNAGDLGSEDFRLFEDGIKQEIAYFSKDKLPLSVMMLIDFSGSVSSIASDLLSRSALALHGLKPDDEVALMYFSGLATLWLDFTTDHQYVEDVLLYKKTVAGGVRPAIAEDGRGGTLIADSIYQAAEQFGKSANPTGRRVMIVITDNEPNGATRYSGKEVADRLYEAGVTVYGIKVASHPITHNLDKYNPVGALLRISMGRPIGQGGNVNTYADKTGGVVLDGRKGKAEEQLTRLIEMLRNRYSFGYVPTNPQMDGKFRRLKLKVSPEIEKREGGVVILAKQGYYARKRNIDAKSAVEKPSLPKQD